MQAFASLPNQPPQKIRPLVTHQYQIHVHTQQQMKQHRHLAHQYHWSLLPMTISYHHQLLQQLNPHNHRNHHQITSKKPPLALSRLLDHNKNGLLQYSNETINSLCLWYFTINELSLYIKDLGGYSIIHYSITVSKRWLGFELPLFLIICKWMILYLLSQFNVICFNKDSSHEMDSILSTNFLPFWNLIPRLLFTSPQLDHPALYSPGWNLFDNSPLLG